MAQELQAEGDDMFTGFASRLDPANLKPSMLQASNNMRLGRGIAQPRRGTKRLTPIGMVNLSMVGSGLFVDSLGRDNIVMVFSDRMYLYRPEQGGAASYTSPAYLFPAGRTIAQGAICDVVQALDKLYIFRGMERDTRYGTGSSSTTSALSFTHAAVNPGATVTVTATWRNAFSTQYAVNDEVTIFNLTAPSTYLLNSFLVKAVNGTTSFTFDYTNTTGTAIVAATGTIYGCVVRAKPPLVWDGSTVAIVPQTSIPNNTQTQTGFTTLFGSMPPADFGMYFQNRVVCNVHPQRVSVSDILSANFDFVTNTFVVNQGGNDSIVGVLPWVQNQFLVFMEKSIFVAFIDTKVDPSIPDKSEVTVVTTEIGCLSRRSIVSAGQFVYFLSANGVQLITPQLDLKLIGNTLPLSEPISDFFLNLNYSAANKSTSVYHDNRFYIAVPWNIPAKCTLAITYDSTVGGQNIYQVVAVGITGLQLQEGETYTFNISSDGIYIPAAYSNVFGQATVVGLSLDSFGYFVAIGGSILPDTQVGGVNIFRVFDRNNRTLIFNTLNQAWESIDSYPEGLYSDNLIQCSYINQRRLMIMTNFTGTAVPVDYGGVFLSENQDVGDELRSESGGLPTLPFDLIPPTSGVVSNTIISGVVPFERINASIRTREYTMGNVFEKRYSRGEYQFNNVGNDSVSISTSTHDPDVTETVLDYTFTGQSDGTLRPRIAARGSSIDTTVNFVNGRPSLKSVAVHAIVANRPMISQE